MARPEVRVVVAAVDEGVDAAVEDGREEHPVSDHLGDLNQRKLVTLRLGVTCPAESRSTSFLK